MVMMLKMFVIWVVVLLHKRILNDMKIPFYLNRIMKLIPLFLVIFLLNNHAIDKHKSLITCGRLTFRTRHSHTRHRLPAVLGVPSSTREEANLKCKRGSHCHTTSYISQLKKEKENYIHVFYANNKNWLHKKEAKICVCC